MMQTMLPVASPPDAHRETAGDPRARRLEALFAAHHRTVLAFALRRVPDRADDVVSETFAIAWRRLDDVPAEALPWLLGVARRVVAGQFRAQARRDALVTRLYELAPSAAGTDEEDHGALFAALARLAERDREALLLVHWEGLDTRQAAAALGCSQAALRVRTHRARTRLRRVLAAEGRTTP